MRRKEPVPSSIEKSKPALHLSPKPRRKPKIASTSCQMKQLWTRQVQINQQIAKSMMETTLMLVSDQTAWPMPASTKITSQLTRQISRTLRRPGRIIKCLRWRARRASFISVIPQTSKHSRGVRHHTEWQWHRRRSAHSTQWAGENKRSDWQMKTCNFIKGSLRRSHQFKRKITWGTSRGKNSFVSSLQMAPSASQWCRQRGTSSFLRPFRRKRSSEAIRIWRIRSYLRGLIHKCHPSGPKRKSEGALLCRKGQRRTSWTGRTYTLSRAR